MNLFELRSGNRIVSLGLIVACLIAAGSYYSCAPKGNVKGGNTIFQTSEDLKPGANPGSKAILRLLTTEIPVAVEHKVEGSNVALRLISKDQELEVEKYRSTTARFELVQAASESFDPPLSLLEFPLLEGAQYSWSGRLKMGEIGPEATAKITVKKDYLNEKGYAGPAILSVVELSFDGGAPTKTVRTLKFWFVEGKGVLKREFDKGSARLPHSTEEIEGSDH